MPSAVRDPAPDPLRGTSATRGSVLTPSLSGWRLPVLAVALVVVPAALATLQAKVLPGGQATGWLAVGPLLASLIFTWRGTALIGGYTLAVALALLTAQPSTFNAVDVVRLAVVVALSVFAVLNCLLRERREARLSQMTQVAHVAQDALVNAVPPRAGNWTFATRYRSAAQLARVGGDLVEVVATPTGMRAMLGDVRGKGLPAVHLASTALTAFRQGCLQDGASLADVARLVDAAVTSRAGDEDFVTAVFIESDDQGWLQIVNCGHPPPLLLPSDAELRALSPPSYDSPLGLAPRLRVHAHPVTVGDRLLLYTDGLMEARDHTGRFFDLATAWRSADGPDLERTLDQLLLAVDEHANGSLDDDLAVLVGRVEQSAPAAERPTPARRDPNLS